MQSNTGFIAVLVVLILVMAGTLLLIRRSAPEQSCQERLADYYLDWESADASRRNDIEHLARSAAEGCDDLEAHWQFWVESSN